LVTYQAQFCVRELDLTPDDVAPGWDEHFVALVKRARRELKFLRTRLGRIIRDIRRQIDGDPALEDCFGPLLDLALRVRHQEQRQRGPKVYSLHAPEVECIGKGKARAPYEFGCKVSIVTPVTAPTRDAACMTSGFRNAVWNKRRFYENAYKTRGFSGGRTRDRTLDLSRVKVISRYF
jgi:hypothetical protein